MPEDIMDYVARRSRGGGGGCFRLLFIALVIFALWAMWHTRR